MYANNLGDSIIGIISLMIMTSNEEYHCKIFHVMQLSFVGDLVVHWSALYRISLMLCKSMATQPLLKRLKPELSPAPSNQKCIICKDLCEETQKNPKEQHWVDFQDVARQWSTYGDTKYCHVAADINWKNGAKGYLWHKDCKWRMCNKKTLEQARRRFEKTKEAVPRLF